MNFGPRPVLVIGHGLRLAGGVDLAPKLLDLGIPVLTSWQAIDLVDNLHPNYFGRPGVYGQRAANKILFEAEHIISIGCRLSVPMVGHGGFPWNARLTVCDIDAEEALKWKGANVEVQDAKEFVHQLLAYGPQDVSSWLIQCGEWAVEWPWLEPSTHYDSNGYINAYAFTQALERYLKPGQIVVTDMGTALITAHQVLRLQPFQRLMTSGGLGEMGCALPAAIGASFARGKGEVLCLHCDGGMMMNLQELQTIVHHNLPVKIIVYRNDSYLMIRHTQKTLGLKEAGVAPANGVSFPDYRKLAHAWGIQAADLRTWEDFEALIPQFFEAKGPALIQYWMDPRQPLVPKLNPVVGEDGSTRAPEFWDLSPRL